MSVFLLSKLRSYKPFQQQGRKIRAWLRLDSRAGWEMPMNNEAEFASNRNRQASFCLHYSLCSFAVRKAQAGFTNSTLSSAPWNKVVNMGFNTNSCLLTFLLGNKNKHHDYGVTFVPLLFKQKRKKTFWVKNEKKK